jgi:hypothetical protein
MLPLSSKERVCGKSGEFSTDSIGDFNTVFYRMRMACTVNRNFWILMPSVKRSLWRWNC